MKLFTRATITMFYVLSILIGCATSEKATSTDQNNFYDEGVALAKAGEYDRAIACFCEVIKLDPEFVDAYIERGITFGYKANMAKQSLISQMLLR